MRNLISGYDKGANITLLNTVYHKGTKLTNYEDSIDLVYKDLDTGRKGVEHIKSPEYTYYLAKPGCVPDTNELWIEKDKVYPVTCKYKNLYESIARNTGNMGFYLKNIEQGNYGNNKELMRVAALFRADMDIEDYYRYEFSKMYRNEPYTPDKLYFDIEVDIKGFDGDFCKDGEMPVNACTMVHEGSNTVYTLLLTNDNNPLINQFRQNQNLSTEVKDFVKECVGGWKNEIRFGLDKMQYKFLFFDEEIKLIQFIFYIINTLKPDFATAWNIAFDLPYLIKRIIRLGYNPAQIICHEDFVIKEAEYEVDTHADKFEERNDYAHISCYTVYVDQMINFASRRKGQRKIPSYKLDYIGEYVAHVRKLDYSSITRDLAELPYLNYRVFAFYNVMDTIVQKCIESRVLDLDFLLTKCIMSCTRYAKAYRQTVYQFNRGIKEFDEQGYIMGTNINKSNTKTSFAGAYVADPCNLSDKPKLKINGMPINIVDNCVDYDYKALYPSEIDENNISPPTMRYKVLLEQQIDPDENRFNNEYFDRTVSFIEDYVSGNRVEFCHRYFNLASYEEVFDDIIEYYTLIVNNIHRLRSRDIETGNIILAYKINNKLKRTIARKVDNTKPRVIAHKVKRRPRECVLQQ